MASHANEMAASLKTVFSQCGFPFFSESCTNQQFPILPDGAVEALERDYSFEVWEKVDQAHTAVRFCTSWSTTDEDVDALIADIQRL